MPFSVQLAPIPFCLMEIMYLLAHSDGALEVLQPAFLRKA